MRLVLGRRSFYSGKSPLLEYKTKCTQGTTLHLSSFSMLWYDLKLNPSWRLRSESSLRTSTSCATSITSHAVAT